MKKIFIQAVLVATVILGGFLAYSIWKAVPVTAQGYFESGKKYYEEKKYPEATIQLMNAVRRDPQHRDAGYFLALAYVNQQDFANASRQLQSLLEYYPEDVEANLQLGSIYLTAGRSDSNLFRQALEIAAKILSKDPNHVGALILSGNASAGLQDYRSSVDVFEKAISLDPQNLAAFVSLGTAQALQKHFPEAEQAFLKARQVDPKDKNVLISLGNYYRAVRDFPKAEAIFKEGLLLNPADRTIYLQAVQFYVQLGRVDEAEKVLNEAQAKSADNPEPSLILIDLLGSVNREADARNIVLGLKDKFPTNIDVAVKTALHYLQDQPDKAKAEIDWILKTEPQNPIGHVLLGQSQFTAGQNDAAEATLNKAPALDSPFPQVHFILGNISMKKGQTDLALFHYQKSLSVNSSYLPARVALAELYLGKGRVDDSKEELRKALETRSDYVPARLLKATIDSADRSNNTAEQEFTTLTKEQPENAIVFRQMGLYYNSRGRTAEAEANLVRALELQPDSQMFLRDLALFYVRQKQTDKAIQRISAIPDAKKQAFHYELMGLVYSQAGKLQDSEAAYRKALEKEPGRTSSDVLLFSDYMKGGRVKEGLQKLDDIIKNNPTDPGAYGIKGQIYESQGKVEDAKQQYIQALKMNPDLPVPANNLAFILAEQGTDLNTALGYAQKARQKQPENASIADTLGWVYYKLGNNVLAREQLRFAVSKEPGNGSFQYHLGMIYKQSAQVPEAQSALKKALNAKDFKEKSLAEAALKEIANLK